MPLTPTSNCDAALTTQCAGYESSSCFCCSTCGATTNAVGVFSIVRSRLASLLAVLVMAAVGQHNARLTPLLPGVFFVASLHLAEAVALPDGVWLILPAAASSTTAHNPLRVAVQAAPLHRYEPLNELEHSERRRAAPSSIVLQRMNVSAFVTENFARTIVLSEQRNDATVAQLATFQMNIPGEERASDIDVARRR